MDAEWGTLVDLCSFGGREDGGGPKCTALQTIESGAPRYPSWRGEAGSIEEGSAGVRRCRGGNPELTKTSGSDRSASSQDGMGFLKVLGPVKLSFLA